MSTSNPGRASATAHILASDIARAQTLITDGNNAAFSAPVYAGIVLFHGVYIQGATAQEVRAMITGNLKRSKAVNDDFVERTMSTAFAFARWLQKFKPVNILQANDLNSGYETALAHFSVIGVSSRKALDNWLKEQNPPAIASAKVETTVGERIGNAIRKGELDTVEAAKVARALGGLSLTSLRAFMEEAGTVYAAALVIAADHGASEAAKALGHAPDAPAFAAAG